MQWKPSCSTRTVGQTDKTKLIITFRNFVKAPKNIFNSCFPINIQVLVQYPGRKCHKVSNLKRYKHEIFVRPLFIYTKHKYSIPTSQISNSVPIIRTIRLFLYREESNPYCENHMKNTIAHCGKMPCFVVLL